MTAFLVQMTGIEPARRKALDPKSSASASSATSANWLLYGKYPITKIYYHVNVYMSMDYLKVS